MDDFGKMLTGERAQVLALVKSSVKLILLAARSTEDAEQRNKYLDSLGEIFDALLECVNQ